MKMNESGIISDKVIGCKVPRSRLRRHAQNSFRRQKPVVYNNSLYSMGEISEAYCIKSVAVTVE